MHPRFAVWIFITAVAYLSADLVWAQDFPNRPVRLITADAGGSSDFVARLIAQGLSPAIWSQQMVVENRGQASGIVAAQTLIKAPPDGYTLLLYGSGIWILSLIQDTPFDPKKDFAPVTLATSSPNVLAVTSASPAKSMKELMDMAKARPGELNFGIGGTGNSSHLSSELFKYMARIDIVRVSYRGIAAAMTGLLGGQLQLLFANADIIAPLVKSGRLRVLAVTSAEPSALFPGLPTIASAGLPGYESTSKAAIFAPARTPAATITKINQDIVRFLRLPETRERLFNSGAEAIGSSPAELSAAMETELASMAPVIKAAGIRGE